MASVAISYKTQIVGKESTTTSLVNASMYDQAAQLALNQLTKAGLVVDGDILTVTKGEGLPVLKYRIQQNAVTTWSIVDGN